MILKSASRLLLVFAAAWAAGPIMAFAQGPEQEPMESRRSEVLRRVSEVRYLGINQIQARDLERALPFNIGDRWKPTFAETAQRALLDYYSRRGFYQARVTVKTANIENDVALIVDVVEGPPCIISEIGISDPPAIKGKANTERFKSRMNNVLKVKAGDRYDEEILADRLRELREFLSKEDFILANTDSVKLIFNDDQTQVRVDVAVVYEDRVTFGFQGNQVFTKGELNEIIAQLKATELGKDYVGVITRKFVEAYRSRAYANVEIDVSFSETPRNKHVTFKIKENTRVEVSELLIEGISAENLKEAQKAFQNGTSRLVQRGFFVESDIDKGVQIVLEHLRSKGYLNAKQISKTILPVKGKPRVKVNLQFFEGEQTLIQAINIEGNHFYTREHILEVLGMREGEPFNPYRLDETLQKLRSDYIDAGFLHSTVAPASDRVVTFSDNNRRAHILIPIEEGTRIKIGDIRVEGLKKTKVWVPMREVNLKTGDWWIGKSVFALEDSLKRLGIFAEVRIKPADSQLGPEYRDMVIEVREGEPGFVEFGPGFRSDFGLRTFARVGYGNLFGRNQNITLAGEANRRLQDYNFIEYNLQTAFVDPRVFSSRNAFTLGLSASKRQFIDFNATQTQFFSSVDRKLFPKLLAKLTYKLERIRQFGAVAAEDNQTLLIGSVTPSLTWDTRDSPFTATRGHITNFYFEYANPAFAGLRVDDRLATGYYKWSASNHFYIPITNDIVWSNVIGGGYIRNLTAGASVPLIKTFRLGGYSTIRGFPEDSINRDRQEIRGTMTFLLFRTQVDLPLAGELKFAPFLDAGNLFLDDRFEGNPFLRAGAGAGLHYVTPIGPINFDYGIKLNRRQAESVGHFHFSVGII